MKRTVDIRERIAVRAYYSWLAHYQAGVVNAVLPGNDRGYWLAAERVELALVAQRRSAAAKKAAATRRARGISPNLGKTVPAEMLVAATRRPTLRPTAH